MEKRKNKMHKIKFFLLFFCMHLHCNEPEAIDPSTQKVRSNGQNEDSFCEEGGDSSPRCLTPIFSILGAGLVFFLYKYVRKKRKSSSNCSYKKDARRITHQKKNKIARAKKWSTHEWGRDIKYQIKRSHFLANVSYQLPGNGRDMKIEIERTTNGEKSYFLIRKLRESDAKRVYKVVKNNYHYLIKYMASLLKAYLIDEGQDKKGAKGKKASIAGIKKNIRWGKQKDIQHSFGIFYSKTPENPTSFKLLGAVGYHSPGAFSPEEKSVDISYWRGDPAIDGIKGVGLLGARALGDYLIGRGYTNRLVIATDRDNKKSQSIALNLGMKESKKEYNDWPYGDEKRENMRIFSISAAAWQKQFFKENVVMKKIGEQGQRDWGDGLSPKNIAE